MDLALKIIMHMNTDSSWKKSATEYIKVYEEIVNQKG